MSHSRNGLLSLLVLCLLATPALAQNKAADDAKAAADANAQMQNRMQTAVTKGVRWLTARQADSGEWTYDNKPLQLGQYPMTSGVTALCAFALLKCGIGPNEEPIRKAFEVIHREGFTYTYEVGCILLALEAKQNFDPNRQPVQAPGAVYDGGTTRTRDVKKKKKKKKAKKAKKDPRDRKLAQACVEWLVDNQRETGLWRYAAGSDEDISNAQYAMLGLDAAERMGIKVPKTVYVKAATRLLEMQCEVSPKDKDKVIQPFPVPGADSSFAQLKKIEAKLLREMKQVRGRFRKVKPGERDKKGFTEKEAYATAERKAAEKITSLTEKRKMVPRGWMYFAPNTGGQIWQRTVTGSLTVSAMASLFICKARLEGTPMWGGLSEKVKDALRNGAAWMSIHFAVNRNPGTGMHQLYYLYGLERAGVLGLIHQFGKHEWFDKGARHLLMQQKSDGSWKGTGSTSGPVPDTCFALLFLSRGTTPVVKLPGRVMTGVKR